MPSRTGNAQWRFAAVTCLWPGNDFALLGTNTKQLGGHFMFLKKYFTVFF